MRKTGKVFSWHSRSGSTSKELSNKKRPRFMEGVSDDYKNSD